MFQDKQIKIVVEISILIFIVLIAIFISNTIKNNKNSSKNNAQNNTGPVLSLTTDSNIFGIESILVYSSANALNNDEMQQDYWNLNLYQFNDLCITIDNHVSIDGLTLKNTIKEMYIDEISYPSTPKQGTPRLYLKNSNLFGEGVINTNNLITDRVDFNISSSNDDEVTSKSFYADCSNPILLSSINEEIDTNFVIRNTDSPVTFDGNLLLDDTILLSNIKYSLSFSIHIINELDEEYICSLTIPIVLSDGNEINSIYDGSYQVTYDDLSESKFYKREN